MSLAHFVKERRAVLGSGGRVSFDTTSTTCPSWVFCAAASVGLCSALYVPSCLLDVYCSCLLLLSWVSLSVSILGLWERHQQQGLLIQAGMSQLTAYTWASVGETWQWERKENILVLRRRPSREKDFPQTSYFNFWQQAMYLKATSIIVYVAALSRFTAGS